MDRLCTFDILLLSTILLLPLKSIAQTTYTVTGPGTNWNNTTSWDAKGIPPSSTNSNVIWNQNQTLYFPQQTSASSLTQTIGSMTMDNSDLLVIGDGVANDKLILGANGTPKDLTANNSATITVTNGSTLEIWGNVTINNHLVLDVQSGGTLIIHGNITMANSATVDVSGTVTVAGSFNMGTSGTVTVNNGGSVAVTGAVNVGNATCLTLNGNGSFTTSGGCSDGSSASCNGGAGFCTVLPISLTSFLGVVQNNTVELTWSTASELNFDHFNLERSSDGIRFNTIAFVKGHGTTSKHNDYTFIDEKPYSGHNFYRLLEVDFDNSITTFNAIAVDFQTSKYVNIYPNPSTDGKLNIEFNYIPTSGSRAFIYSLQGNLVMSVQLDSQIQEIKHSLTPGLYIVKIFTSDLSRIERLVVKEPAKE